MFPHHDVGDAKAAYWLSLRSDNPITELIEQIPILSIVSLQSSPVLAGRRLRKTVEAPKPAVNNRNESWLLAMEHL